MPSVSFWKCHCGIEWQAIQGSDHQPTVYACICGRRRTFKGKAIDLYYAPAGGGLRDTDWKKVTVDKFEVQE